MLRPACVNQQSIREPLAPGAIIHLTCEWKCSCKNHIASMSTDVRETNLTQLRPLRLKCSIFNWKLFLISIDQMSVLNKIIFSLQMHRQHAQGEWMNTQQVAVPRAVLRMCSAWTWHWFCALDHYYYCYNAWTFWVCYRVANTRTSTRECTSIHTMALRTNEHFNFDTMQLLLQLIHI